MLEYMRGGMVMWWIVLPIIGIIAFFMILNRNAKRDEAAMQKRRWRRILKGDYEFALTEHENRRKRRQEELVQAIKMLDVNEGELSRLDFDHPTTELEEIAKLYPHDERVIKLIDEIKKTNAAREKMQDPASSAG